MNLSNRASMPAGDPVQTDQSWRGGGERRKAIRHRWQQDWTAGPMRRVQASERRRRIRLALLFLVFAAATAGLVQLLLFARPQTPMLAVVATDYDWPLPPNAWSREDLLGLRGSEEAGFGLDGQNLSITDASDAWESKDRGLRDFSSRLRTLARSRGRARAVVIYVSMHGAVDEQGEPCLIPPGATAHNSQSWIALRQILAEIKNQDFPEQVHKLLILDASRMRANWSAGLLAGGFADRLADVVNASDVPNLVVLNSTQRDEIGWASPDLQGSVFGHFLKLGLAGAADRESTSGDSDGMVSVKELAAYLERHVDRWVRFHRADRQRPMLVPSGAADFNLCRALAKSSLDAVLEEAAAVRRTEASVPAARLATLWEAHARYRDRAGFRPYALDPLRWADLEHDLLWLEEAAVAGSAYKAPAQQLYEKVRDDFLAMKRRSRSEDDEGTPNSRWNLMGDDALRLPEAPALHSLALLEYFGRIKPSAAEAIRNQSAPWATAPPQGDESMRLAGRYGIGALVDFQLPQLLGQYGVGEEAYDAALLREVVDSRLRAERLAANGDERAFGSIRGALDTADRAQRSAENALLARGDAEKIRETLATADRLAELARQQHRSMTAALDVHDRAWAELPHLARWVARPLPATDDNAQADERVNELLGLIDDAHRLSRILARGPAEDSDLQQASVQEPSEIVRRRLSQIRTWAEAAQAALLAAPAAERRARVLREMDAVMQLPSVAPSDRAELRRRRDQIAAALHLRYLAAVAENKPLPGDASRSPSEGASGGEPFPGDSYAFRVTTQWNAHPALAMLQHAAAKPGQTGAPGAAESPRTAAQQGAAVRAALADLPRQVRILQEAETPDAAQYGVSIHRAEHRIRTAAGFDFPRPTTDPVGTARRYDLQQLLLWHARRVIDDFWGPAGSQQEPLFAVAAANYLQSAARLFDGSPALAAQREALSELLQKRRVAATRGVSLQVRDIPLVSRLQPARTDMQLRAGADAAALPAGAAALLVRDSRGRRMGATFLRPAAGGTPSEPMRSLAMPLAESPQRIELVGDDMAAGDGNLVAIVSFRGNEFAAPFLVGGGRGIRVQLRPYVYDKPPTVIVTGRRQRRASISILLDCSDSMATLVDIEAPRGTEGEPSRMARMEVAKSALLAMLTRLARRGNVRVGVRFYGHRVGRDPDDSSKVVRAAAFAKDIPPGLLPSEDVERILPLGRFDSTMVGRVAAELQKVKPWGETPLYLGIIEAIKDFSGEDADVEKQIIVLTDGINYQFNSPDPKTHANVLSAIAREKVPVHIVGFQIAASDAAQAQREFDQIATRSGGSFVLATEAPALIRAMERLLGTAVYQVVDQRTGRSTRSEVGQSVTLPEPDRRSAYGLSIETLQKIFEVRGGEALQFRISADGRRLETQQYLDRTPTFRPLVDMPQGNPTGYQLGIHQPILRKSGDASAGAAPEELESRPSNSQGNRPNGTPEPGAPEPGGPEAGGPEPAVGPRLDAATGDAAKGDGASGEGGEAGNETHAAHIRFSIQSQRRDFVARPVEVWIEIDALLPRGQGVAASYLFYDANYRPGTAVPVLDCVARDWPALAREARVRFWCQREPTEPNRIALGDALAIAARRGGPIAVPGVPGVSLQVVTAAGTRPGEPYRIGIVERHAAGGPDVHGLKVGLATSVRPEEVIHEFDAEHRVVTHTFVFRNVDPKTLEDDARSQILLTPRDTARAGAWQLEEAAVVDISDPAGLIKPTVATEEE